MWFFFGGTKKKVMKFIKSSKLKIGNLEDRQIIFLETLKQKCQENNVEYFYHYVKNLCDYYKICYVKDRSVIEIVFSTQCVDDNDHFFNMIYDVERILFNNIKNINERMTIVGEPDDGKELVDQKDPKSNYTSQRKWFTHQGSNTDYVLVIHWIIDLKKIQEERPTL